MNEYTHKALRPDIDGNLYNKETQRYEECKIINESLFSAKVIFESGETDVVLKDDMKINYIE